MQIEVVMGDITRQTDVDSVLWLLHIGGRDYSGQADLALKRVEPRFHQGLIAAHKSGDFCHNKDTVLVTVLASKTGYGSVIFVGDEVWKDAPLPLGEVVLAGLQRADAEGFSNLAMIPFRTGKAGRLFNQSEQERALVETLKQFQGSHLELARIVVFSDHEQAQRLRQMITE